MLYEVITESSSLREQRDVAKLIEREKLSDPVVLDVIEQRLLREYKGSGSNSIPKVRFRIVITSYSIHYTKLYERLTPCCNETNWSEVVERVTSYQWSV